MKNFRRDDLLVIVVSLAALVLSSLLRLLYPDLLFGIAQGASLALLLLFLYALTIDKLLLSPHRWHNQIGSLLITMALLSFVAIPLYLFGR